MSKSIMILGTSSGAGKSTIATGISRILLNKGYTVSPFKAQNMSNNGHKLKNGLEMARSQAIGAYACKIEPNENMNPILLKILPEGIEVVYKGKSKGVMNDEEYRTFKEENLEGVLQSFEKLKNQYNVVVLEGAGSPVEMNLKPYDIVNIKMAKETKSPVFLVADIDRGGVFASVYGTIMLLTEEERKLVKGIILNRLRGKSDHYKDVKKTMEDLVKIPVVGMIPYLDIKIEDEDSLIDHYTGVKLPQTMEEMEKEFDLLAGNMEKYLDMDKLINVLEKGLEA